MSDKLLVSVNEISLTNQQILNKKQIQALCSPTPQKFIKTRPGKGGQTWRYVKVSYVKGQLNKIFGYAWDFDIVGERITETQVIVKGQLTVFINGQSLRRTQFGRCDIKNKKDGSGNVDLGNDMKAAASDALKKCAADFGIAQDVYDPEEFYDLEITELPEEYTRAARFIAAQKSIEGLDLAKSTWPELFVKYPELNQILEEKQAKFLK